MPSQLSLFETAGDSIYPDDVIAAQMVERAKTYGRHDIIDRTNSANPAIDPRLAGFAVIEAGGAVVYGIGIQWRQAMADALAACKSDSALKIDTVQELYAAVRGGELDLVRCSRKLFKEVETYGGDLDAIDHHNGHAYLPGERKI